VLTTSQESKLLGGRRRQDFCRLQIWTASPPMFESPIAGQTIYAQSTSSASRRSSETSLLNMSPRRKSSVFTLSSVSLKGKTYTNSISSSSSSSVIMDSQSPTNFVVPAGGATVYTPPVTPCIVLFAHRVPGRGEEEKRSFLVIDGELSFAKLHLLTER
jgi:hypothetical protein